MRAADLEYAAAVIGVGFVLLAIERAVRRAIAWHRRRRADSALRK